ncbi:MAG: hypothetical protein LUQ65_12525 [Candidatus Helarchaeota archaeon]|nr:hypothetical protein [Candidatus Helarchaeota archaeon]
MADLKSEKLKKRIIEEMTVDYSNALERNFDLAKQFIRVSKEGKIEVLLREKLGGKEQILLYLIGKLYAKEAGFATTEEVGNKELMDELGVPKGSVLPWLMDLRDKKKIRAIKRGKGTNHVIPVNLIDRALKDIEKSLKKRL